MKKFLKCFILLMIMIIFSINANAESQSDWKLSASLYKVIASDPDSILQSGFGLQMSLHKKSVFLYISKDIMPVRFAGQGGPDVDLWSIGFGFDRKLGEYLTLTCDIGWYEAGFKGEGDPQVYPNSSFSEGLCRYLNYFLQPDDGYPAWDYYTLDYDYGSIGGKIGLSFDYPITNWMSVDMKVGYRYLKLSESVKGKNWSDGTDWASINWWQIKYDRDFSGWCVGGAFNIYF